MFGAGIHAPALNGPAETVVYRGHLPFEIRDHHKIQRGAPGLGKLNPEIEQVIGIAFGFNLFLDMGGMPITETIRAVAMSDKVEDQMIVHRQRAREIARQWLGQADQGGAS